jgi:hypothetical protein
MIFTLRIVILTKFIMLCSSYESVVAQFVMLFLWKPKVHYHVHNGIVHFSPVLFLMPSGFSPNFNIALLSTPRSSKYIFSFRLLIFF